MKYIKYWNYYTDNLLDGFLISEDEKHYKLCEPLIYEWIHYLNDFSLLDESLLVSVLKKEFHYIEETYVSPFDPWVFQFEINRKEKKHFREIVRFFECFFQYPRKKLTKKLEYSIQSLPRKFDKKITKKLIEFILEYSEKDPDRLRVVFSPIIQKHLNHEETFLHQYIHYHDGYSGDMYEAYLLKEDSDSYYVLEPLMFRWILHTNRLDLLDEVECYQFEKAYFSYKIQEHAPFVEEWLLNFPFAEDDIPYIRGMIYFFETFQRYHEFPFIKRVEICIRHKQFPIPEQTVKRLVKFLAENFKHERVRMLMSDLLRNYLQN